MRAIDWILCDDCPKAKGVCDRLVKIGARVINVAGAGHGWVVWFEHEGEVDKDALLKGDEA